MIQGVREVFEIVDLDREEGSQQGQGQGQGKIVLIGRGLVGLPIEESLRFALEEQ